MDANKKRVFKLLFAWQDDKEEQWLSDMAAQGFHLRDISVPGFYTFEVGQPRHVVYRLDFNTTDHDESGYRQLFSDAGWECVLRYGGWTYFRTEARPGENPEIYTDNASKAAKYQRLMGLMVVFLPILIVTQTSLTNSEPTIFTAAVRFVAFVLLLLYIYAMLMLIRRVTQLRRAGG